MPRIALADDHPIVRRGFKQLIETVPGYVVALEHSHGLALLDDPELDLCDLLVLDITLPDLDGFDVLRRLAPRARRPEVVVLSMHEELPYVREAMGLGARGYLAKSGADDELLLALAAVSEGGTYLGASFRERLDSIGPDRDPAFPELTARECEIVRALVRGETIRIIGERLGMSRKTVYVHRSNLLGKLGVGTDVELVRLARQRGLLTVS
jgi:two-component system, NarL family, response regulator FusR